MSDLVGNPEDRFSHNDAQMYSLPGHGRLSDESPMQPRPRAEGDGLVHVRCRCDSPQATELLHDDQLVQVLQPPFTVKRKQHRDNLIEIQTYFNGRKVYKFPCYEYNRSQNHV